MKFKFLRRLAAQGVIISILILGHGVAVKAEDVSSAFEHIHSSVVLIYNGRDHSLGSGVVIASDSISSKILTAAHVVGTATVVQVYIRDNLSTSYRARVVKKSTVADLALLNIDKGGLEAADIGDALKEGQSVAAIGYPLSSYELLIETNELKPGLHAGIVSAIHSGGRLIEHTAVADHGNSGGPLIEVQSGYVVGIIRSMHKAGQDSYIATGYKAIEEFLGAAAVATPIDNAHSAILRNVPGAFQIAITHGPIVDTPEQSSMRGFVDERVIPRLQGLFPGVIFRMVPGPQNDPASYATFCRQQSFIGVLFVGESWSFTPPPNIYVFPQVSAGLDVALVDCNLESIASSKKTKNVKSGSYDARTAIVSSIDDLEDQVIADLTTQVSARPTALQNFFRFGYYMEDRQKRAFFNLIPGPGGAIVSYVAPFGTAARAGLQRGLIITEVNGQPTSGLSQTDLDALLMALPQAIKLGVLNADGTRASLTFQSQDIRWYVSHPPTTHAI